MKIEDNSSDRIKKIVLGLLLCSIVSIPFFYKIEANSFHGDENLWLRTTKYFKLFFIDRDFKNKQWKEISAYDQPPVGRYIIGLAIVIAGHRDRFGEIDRIPEWNFEKSRDWNISNGAVPPEDILYDARFVMALLGALTCFLIYWVGRTVLNKSAGILASLLLAYNPLMLWCCKRAMTEAPLLFFMTANVALLVLFYSSLLKQKTIQTLLLAGVIGINIALAAGTKLNGGLTGIIFAMIGVLFILAKTVRIGISFNHPLNFIKRFISERTIKITLVSLFLSGSIAILVFVGLNPYLYGQPLKGSIKIIEHRAKVIKNQQVLWGPPVTSFGQKFKFVILRTLIDRRYTTLNYFIKIPLDLGFFLLGFVLLLYNEGKYLLLYHKPSTKSILLIWVSLTFAGMIAWIPLDWERYYLSLFPCVAIMAGYGLERVLNLGWQLAKSAANRNHFP